MPLSNETLNRFIQTLLEEGPYVLASREDADYFRKAIKKLPKEEKPLPLPIKVEPPAIQIQAQLPTVQPALQPPPPSSKPSPKLEAPPPPEPTDFASIRRILSVVAPELLLLDEIPSDHLARKIAERWKTKNQSAPISILVFQEPPEQRAFLEQIAKAIDIYFGSAKIVQAEGIEKEKQWGAFLSVADLKTIVVCDYTLWQLAGLMQHYKETPAQGIRLLGSVPLFLLPDLSLYLKDPLLKRSLWKALCQKFS